MGRDVRWKTLRWEHAWQVQTSARNPRWDREAGDRMGETGHGVNTGLQSSQGHFTLSNVGDHQRLLSRGGAGSDLGFKGNPSGCTWRMDTEVQGKSWDPRNSGLFEGGVHGGREGCSDVMERWMELRGD